MTDRVPVEILENGAIRYGIYDESETLLRYEYIKREDAAVILGTLLSKGNLLSDTTAEALGLDPEDDPTPNDAFGAVYGKSSILTAITAALYGLSSSAVPNDVLALLSAVIVKDGTALKDILGNLITIPSGQISGGLQIETGSYAGTGTYGSGNPNSIPTDITDIKLLIVQGSSTTRGNRMMIAVNPGVSTSYAKCYFYGTDANVNRMTWASGEASWYTYGTATAELQLNESGAGYNYLIAGAVV